MNELLTVPMLELARRIRAKEISPVEVVEAHIARIEEVNPHINAVAVTSFDAAREEAARAERHLSGRTGDELPAFFGVPCTIKELISVKGLPYTAGVVARKHVVGEEDAPLVARLRAAGCIILGLTNISEAGLWLETYNRIYGRTTNAYSTRHISGGSSGGEGAIIGAGGSPLGLGADIGGSIRNPCFFNGIAGHKPTGGLLPSVGHWPPAEGTRGRYCVTGPMGRRVRDVARAMEILSPEVDPWRDADRPPFRALERIDPRRTRVFWFDSNGLARPSAEMKDAMRTTARALESRGFIVEEWRPKRLARSAEMWAAKLAETDDLSVKELLGNGTRIELLPAWLRMVRGRGDHALASLVMATLEGVSDLTEKRTHMLVDMTAALQREIEEKLGEDGVLMCPPYPRSAPQHHVPMLNPLAFSYCGVFNVLELPATAVPIGFGAEGLPLGVQVAARRFGDALALAVAEHIEDELGGWRPPSADFREVRA